MHADDPMNNSVDDWISILEGVDQDTLDVLGHIPASPASIGHVELLKKLGRETRQGEIGKRCRSGSAARKHGQEVFSLLHLLAQCWQFGPRLLCLGLQAQGFIG